jgi:haloacetate dehalogenase
VPAQPQKTVPYQQDNIKLPRLRYANLPCRAGRVRAGGYHQLNSPIAEGDVIMPSNAPDFLPGFRQQVIPTTGTTINVSIGGSGPPLMMLHGYPQTHIEWRKIAPELAQSFTVVLPDLRGYGESGKPDGGENHVNYSKRAMALDQVEVMTALGFDKFAFVGHDRGARVGHRLALDHPQRLTKVALLDICPTLHMYNTTNMQFAAAYHHWFFLIQSAPYPETLIGNSVEMVLKSFMGALVPAAVEPAAFAEYLRCFRDPAAIHGSCEDYRAAATIDLAHDKADLDKKIACPLLVLWGANGVVGKMYDVPAIWRERATSFSGKALACGHWMPEEAPNEVISELKQFLAG